jgi:hypothetical protein
MELRISSDTNGSRGWIDSPFSDLILSRIDWDHVLNRQLSPPYIPSFTSENDTVNFDQYDDSAEDLSPALFGKDQEIFVEF